MESILTSIKKMLGIAEEYTHFDMDLIMHINSVLTILTQLGVGPSKGFSIRDENDSWEDFFSKDSNLESVKSYVYMKVRLLFDPPQSSAVTESINRLISELEWRINVEVETGAIASAEEINSEKIEELQSSVNDIKTQVSEHDELFDELVGDSE